MWSRKGIEKMFTAKANKINSADLYAVADFFFRHRKSMHEEHLLKEESLWIFGRLSQIIIMYGLAVT